MKISEAYPSKYLSAADLQGKQPTVFIAAVEMASFDGDHGTDTKPLVSFQGKQKGLILNKTNAQAIAEMYGDDTDAWVGKAVKLVTARVDFQGRRVEAIRIDPPDRQPGTVAFESAPKPVPAKAVERLEDFDDPIPF